MDKEITKYAKEIAKKLDNKLSIEDLKNLRDYNKETIANFQHERLIHLLVTLGFTLIMIIFMILTVGYSLFAGLEQYSLIIDICLKVVFLAMLITDLFYLRYYCRLENGVQSLYKFSKEINEKIQST